ncbi:MAG: YraN family protein [Acetobacter sp.]|nr:YraN family protein [Bacteroides sp.]MCM1341409.1 YraN family protein [Acetobacter sp.]MCM1433363.1 YraN family protein [Clostridiales bacterium]
MNNKGKIWEIEAANYLRRKHYKLVDSNYTTRFGEIDLIVKNKKYICFVEVKQRDIKSIARPAEFVTYKKQQRIITSAQLFLSQNRIDLQPRFDVIEIYTENNKINSIKHLENAFELL